MQSNTCAQKKQLHKSHQKILTPDVLYLFKIFKGQLRLVGGVVRDFYLNKKINDFDMASPLTPNQMINLFNKHNIPYLTIGLKHGTITALIHHKTYEITSLRCDKKTDGRHAEVSFIHNYFQDSLRRDLTINSLYMDQTGLIYDYQNAFDDLKTGLIRFIGDPEQRVQEDYLRILRFFRFFAFYGKVEPDNKSYQACIKHQDGLKTIAKERIQEEFLRLLSAKNPISALIYMEKAGLLNTLNIQADISRLERFLTLFPKSGVLERLSILTNEQEKPLPCLSKEQKRLLSAYQKEYDFKNKQETRFLLWQLDKKIFLFHLNKALFNGFITKNQYQKIKTYHKPVFKITGKDLIKLGFQGVEIKQALEKCLLLWKENDFPTKKSLVIKQLLIYTKKRDR